MRKVKKLFSLDDVMDHIRAAEVLGLKYRIATDEEVHPHYLGRGKNVKCWTFTIYEGYVPGFPYNQGPGTAKAEC
jgi:hypothetical protein